MTGNVSAERANPLRTRADVARLVHSLFAPLTAHFSPGSAQVRIGPESGHFDRKAEWFEGFARPLWGLAPLHAGGLAFEGWDRFAGGIESGCDPEHEEYWETVGDHDQRSVEMAALGFALALAPDKLWEPLSPAARTRLATWLGGIQRVAMADNNWHFFPVMAGLGLERVGIAIDRASRDAHLARIEELYLHDGWYADGPGGYIDHYNGFALQFYGLIYASHRAAEDSLRAKAYRDRAAAFARGFAHWFADDGATLPIGRSLTYRFATAAFWGALAYADVEALPWGQIRGLWARQIRWWLQQPMLDASGLLPIGYTTPNVLMSEEYNSQGSPYWAFKAFLPLALADDHPFWTADEAPHPASDGVTYLPGASMLVQRRGGEVIALPGAPVRPDMRNSADKYGKFAYSTAASLAVEGERWIELGFCGDNLLAVSADGATWAGRRANISMRSGDGFIETVWSPLPGATITTLQGFAAGWEIRAHRIESSHELRVIESGHALPAHTRSRRALAGACDDGAERPAGTVLELADGRLSAMACLRGERGALVVAVAPNTHLQFPKASVPVLAGTLPQGANVLLTACGLAAGLAGPTEDAVAALLAAAGWPALPASMPKQYAVERRAVDTF
jgi:hypothetical protein